MKKIKLVLTVFALIFAVQVSKAKQSYLNQNTLCIIEASNASMVEDYELLNKEADASFDFNTKDYLPVAFNAYSEEESITTAYELLNKETDSPFDFDVLDYLPQSLSASL